MAWFGGRSRTGREPPQAPGQPEVERATSGTPLHLAVVLVGREGLPVSDVLHLTWDQVDLPSGTLLSSTGVSDLAEPVAELLHAAARRQRRQRRVLGTHTRRDYVIVDDEGSPYSQLGADRAISRLCERAGLPAVSLASTRAPLS